MIRLAIGRGVTSRLINIPIEPCVRILMVISPKVYVLLHHLMTDLQPPNPVRTAAAQPRLRPKRQTHSRPDVMPLIVMKLDDRDPQSLVVAKAIPNPHLSQQPRNKRQIALAVLHHLLTLRILPHHREQEILPLKIMPRPQDALDNLRHGLVLINPKLPPTGQQRQARLQSNLVPGLVSRTGKPFKTRHHTMQRPQRFNPRHPHPTNRHRQRMRRRMQTELRFPPQHPFSPDVLFNRGKFHPVTKRLTQLFLTLEGKNIERNGQTMNNKFVATVIEERR